MSTHQTKMNMKLMILVLVMPLLLMAGELPAPGTGEGAVEEAAVQDTLSEFNIQTLPGFEVQHLYEVPGDEQGSWVALEVLPNGNLVASDQDKAGLFRISVGESLQNPEVDVEELTAIPISGAQGLEYAFDQLYVNVNGVGLFKLDSTDGGGFNRLEYVVGSPDGGGEHGNHSIIPTEDGEGLYAIFGNSTNPPATYTSRVASWDEDNLLPRNWDVGGHARGRLAPGGFIARINPEATEWEIISMGYRNPYDLALNPQGELFAYDADMEHDMGMPWYRPTRIMHAVSGSDTGWRGGDGKWKTYFEDSIPPVMNIGPGSPTGLLFGTGARFPEQYQRALYAIDWTFGTIRAIHLTPEGASYTGEAEEFISGSPLPLTDAVVGQDGHMYFTTGGRGIQSSLWRVVYTGNKSTDRVGPLDNPEARRARELRRSLEAYHGQVDNQAVATAWEHLNSEDRFIRNAARVAIEWQPVESWAERALNEENPQARITALTALARMGSDRYRNDAIASLMELDLSSLTASQKLGYLRAMSLVFDRMGSPNEQQRLQISNMLQPLLPSEEARFNVELVRMLVYLDDPRVIDKALALMEQESPEAGVPDWGNSFLERNIEDRYGDTIQKMIDNPPPVNKLEYAYMLRNMRTGWTIDQRREYFSFINEAAGRMGGRRYAAWLELMRSQALNNTSEEQIAAISDLTGVSLTQEPDFDINPPQGPGRVWTVDEAEEVVESNLVDQNFERGRSLFHATGCASCHRFGGFGGSIGPDLNTVGNRFGIDEILSEIINPSEIMSDQYSSSVVTQNNGNTITGMVVERADNLEIYSKDPEVPPMVVEREDVATVKQAEVSIMPPGLINQLSDEELRDLLAYLVSGGNPEAEVYEEKPVEN